MKKFNLDDHPKIHSGFKEPEGYFDQFPDILMEKINAEEPKVIPIFARRKTFLTAAAAILVLALLIPVYNNFYVNEQQPDLASIENYITYQSNIQEDEIVSLLENNDVEAIDNDILVEDKTIEDLLISNNNFENYITD